MYIHSSEGAHPTFRVVVLANDNLIRCGWKWGWHWVVRWQWNLHAIIILIGSLKKEKCVGKKKASCNLGHGRFAGSVVKEFLWLSPHPYPALECLDQVASAAHGFVPASRRPRPHFQPPSRPPRSHQTSRSALGSRCERQAPLVWLVEGSGLNKQSTDC